MSMLVLGEIMGQLGGISVLVSNLTSEGCDFVARTGHLSFDGAWSLWIGAIGPLAITNLTGRTKGAFHANFGQSLDEKIVHHFNCTSVISQTQATPDCEDGRAGKSARRKAANGFERPVIDRMTAPPLPTRRAFDDPSGHIACGVAA